MPRKPKCVEPYISKWLTPKRNELIKQLKENVKADPEMFTLIKLAASVDMSRQALMKIGNIHPDVATAIEECQEVLEDRMLTGAFLRRYDSTITRFVLNTRYGYKENNETTVTHKQAPEPQFGDE